MTCSHGLVQIGRWLLPWIAVVFASAALVYAVNGALAGNPSAGEPRSHVQATAAGEQTGPPAVELAITALYGQSTGAVSFVTPEHCPPIGTGYGSYVDSSIVAESHRIACGQGAP